MIEHKLNCFNFNQIDNKTKSRTGKKRKSDYLTKNPALFCAKNNDFPSFPRNNAKSKNNPENNIMNQPPVSVLEDSTSIEAVKKILSAGFFASSSNTDNTVDAFQGTSDLRKQARLETLNCIDALSTKILRHSILKEENKTLRILQLKRLGHALNIAETISFKDSTVFKFCGFNEAFTIPMIASSVKHYSEQSDSEINKETGEFIAKELINSYSNDFVNLDAIISAIQESDNKIISISGGYDWHVIHLLFFSDCFIFINRGHGCELNSGIQVFKLSDKKKVTKELLRKLIERMSINKEEWLKNYNVNHLIKLLDLNRVFYLKQRGQLTGNCSYVNTKSAIRALLAISFLKKEYGEKAIPNNFCTWCKAFDSTKKQYKEWSRFDKRLVVEDIMKDICYLQKDSLLISKEEYIKIFKAVLLKTSRKPADFAAVKELEELKQKIN